MDAGGGHPQLGRQASRANAALTLGAWVSTEGVNTAPGSDAEKYQIVYTFRDAAGADILGQPVVLDLPQSAASTGGWVEVTTPALGDIILPVDAVSVTAEVRKGSGASGTVYVDDFFVRGGGGWHGSNVDLPGDWYTYWPGFDGGVANPNWVVAKTTAESHTGAASLRVERLGEASPTRRPSPSRTACQPPRRARPRELLGEDRRQRGPGDDRDGRQQRRPDGALVLVAGERRGGVQRDRRGGHPAQRGVQPAGDPAAPAAGDNGWTQYSFVVYPHAGAVGMELRLRYWHNFTGVTYWDDVFIGDVAEVVAEVPNLLPRRSGFEGRRRLLVALWRGGDVVVGAGALRHALPRALRRRRGLVDAGRGHPQLGDRFPANAALTLGAWVYTEGVNTAPGSDDEKFQIVYTFRDAAGADLLGQPVVLDLPQAAASTGGWVEVTTAGARRHHPAGGRGERDGGGPQGRRRQRHGLRRRLLRARRRRLARRRTWTFRATGTRTGRASTAAWRIRTGSWRRRRRRRTRARRRSAWSVSASMLRREEAVAISDRVPATEGEPVLVSYWVKTEGNADPATIGTGDNNIGLTALWYCSLESGAAGYNEIGGADIRLNGEYNPHVIPLLPQQADNGWTNYAFVVYPLPETRWDGGPAPVLAHVHRHDLLGRHRDHEHRGRQPLLDGQ